MLRRESIGVGSILLCSHSHLLYAVIIIAHPCSSRIVERRISFGRWLKQCSSRVLVCDSDVARTRAWTMNAYPTLHIRPYSPPQANDKAKIIRYVITAF